MKKRSLSRKRLDSFILEAAEQANQTFQQTGREYLDHGCGGSPYIDRFDGWKRIGMDFAERKGVDVVGDVQKLPFDDCRFDMVLSTEVLEHVAQPEIVIKEAHRVLKEGGMLILSTRFCYPIHQAPYDHFRYTSYGLKHLLMESGFTITTLKPDTSSLEALGVQLSVLARNSTASKLSKTVLYGLGWFLRNIPKLTREEYGDMRTNNTVPIPHIISNGYHVIAVK